MAPVLHPGLCSLFQPPSATPKEQEDNRKELSEQSATTCQEHPEIGHRHFPIHLSCAAPARHKTTRFKIRRSQLHVFRRHRLLQGRCLLPALSPAEGKFMVALENIPEKFKGLSTNYQGEAAPVNSCMVTRGQWCSVRGCRVLTSSR